MSFYQYAIRLCINTPAALARVLSTNIAQGMNKLLYISFIRIKTRCYSHARPLCNSVAKNGKNIVFLSKPISEFFIVIIAGFTFYPE